MSVFVKFSTAMEMIGDMENIMVRIFPQWNYLSGSAKLYVMLRYAHMTFAFLSKEKHHIDMRFTTGDMGMLYIHTKTHTYQLTPNDRCIIDDSNLIWAVMPVVPNGCMSLSLDGSACALRFECTEEWTSLVELFREVSLNGVTDDDREICTYSIIPVDEDGNEYPE